MAYKVVWHAQALDELWRIDRTTAGKIVERIKSHLSQDPEKLGKSLQGVLEGLKCYRWGDHRIIFTVDKAEALISALHIGHRKNVFK